MQNFFALNILTFAAIDIGSNAMRLLLMNVIENGKAPSFRKTTLIRVPIRLGEEAFSQKKISRKKIKQLLLALKSFRFLMDATGIVSYRACATSAMREARNRTAVVKRIKKETGINIEVIDGKEEADIIYSTHIEEMLDHRNSYLYVDVGGGSTELTLFAKNKLVASRSFNVGAVRQLKGIVKKEDVKEMKKWVKKYAARHQPLFLIGSGGNINKIFKLSGAKSKRNASLSIEQVTQVYKLVKSYSIEDRIKFLDMNPDRADVIIPASDIFLDIMQWSGSRRIYVPKIGLADGIVRQLYKAYREKNAAANQIRNEKKRNS